MQKKTGMYFTIYKITNTINNKHYIGKHQTKDLNDGYMGSGKLIKSAIKKYGIENFMKEILFVFDNEAEMNAKEAELVIIDESSYNLCEGGKGGFGYINQRGGKLKARAHSKEILEKISLTKKDRAKSGKKYNWNWAASVQSRKKKYPDGIWKNKKHSEETKAKLRKPKNIGSNNPSYGSCWINNGKENKRILLEELDIWIDKGYNRGRRMNLYGDQVYKKAFLFILLWLSRMVRRASD